MGCVWNASHKDYVLGFFFFSIEPHVLKVTLKFAILKLGHTGAEENM